MQIHRKWNRRSVLFGSGVILLGVVMLGAIGWYSDVPTTPVQYKPPTVAVNEKVVDATETFRPYEGVVPVITYHEVGDTRSPYVTSPIAFAEQMAALADAGFHTITLDALRRLVSGQDVVLPESPILITFDDVGPGVWANADPILATHGFVATAFPVVDPSDALGGRDVATIAQLRAMKESGRWSFGSHTESGHSTVSTLDGPQPWMTNLQESENGSETVVEWERRVRADLAASISWFQSTLGVRVNAMSYPNSSNGLPHGDAQLRARLPEIVGSMFDLSFVNSSSSVAVSYGIDRAMVPRIPAVTSDLDAAQLLGQIDESIARPPVDAIPVSSWIADGDGQCVHGTGTLLITANSDTTCVLSSRSTTQWADVAVSGVMTRTGADVDGVVRVRTTAVDEIAVSLGPDSVRVDEEVRGVWTQRSTTPLMNSDPPNDRAFSVRVKGTRLLVIVDGVPVADLVVDPALVRGGIELAAVTDRAGVVGFTHLELSTAWSTERRSG